MFSPLIEVKSFRDEEELSLSFQKELPCSGNPRFVCVFTDMSEAEFFLFKVIPKTNIVKVGWNVDECVRHDGISVLWQDLVSEKLKSVEIINKCYQ